MPTIRREDLFRRVWETPAYKLAPELGLSGRGLAKLCKRFDVPMPPIGYFWQPLPQNEHGRFNPGVERSACVPFHSVILDRLNAGATVRAIWEHIKALGFPGSHSSVRVYCANLLRGQPPRVITSRNRFGEFKMKVVSGWPKPYLCERPALPPGPEFVTYKEPGARLSLENTFTPYQPTAAADAHREKSTTVELPKKESPLAPFEAELTYARDKFPELYLMFWLEIGADIPSVAYSTLDWSQVQVQEHGQEWQICVRNAWERQTLVRVSPRAVEALRPYRRTSGHVFKDARTARRARNCLPMIAGPEWRRHLLAIRKAMN